ncbi:hypothetical protein Csa_016544 [Cucumis sativus]|uniref:Uncharacterized protein n=1 Tax=Cucumis sativus TaxID=3659 RepID=A0A0A0K743_CUCSA|nr:hypothetical protein Csa_016544 [Cucumis sativus]
MEKKALLLHGLRAFGLMGRKEQSSARSIINKEHEPMLNRSFLDSSLLLVCEIARLNAR